MPTPRPSQPHMVRTPAVCTPPAAPAPAAVVAERRRGAAGSPAAMTEPAAVEHEAAALDEEEEEEVGHAENVVLRFPKEQVEEMVDYLIAQLMDQQGLSEEEAGARAAEVLDDPEAQLVMAWELNKPTLTKALKDFYVRIDREDLLDAVEAEVDEFSGRTDDLIASLLARHEPTVPGVAAELAHLMTVSAEEKEWVAMAERSASGETAPAALPRRSTSSEFAEQVGLTKKGRDARSRSGSTATAAAGSEHPKRRRFLHRFLHRFEPDACSQEDVDNLLLAYHGRHAQLRKDLCAQHESNPDALRALRSMPVDAAVPQTARERWLAANAASARRYYEKAASPWVRAVGAFDKVCLSATMKAWGALWLAVATAFALMYSVYAVAQLGLAAFAGEGIAAGGIGCAAVLVMYLTASYVTLLLSILRGWVFLGADVFYGDADFSLVAGTHNPVPGHLRHALPPRRRLTLLNLPTYACLPRSAYTAAVFAGLVVAPLVGGAAAAAAEDGGLLEFLGHAAYIATIAVLTATAALWLRAWVVAAGRKVAHLRRRVAPYVRKVTGACAGDPCCCCLEAPAGEEAVPPAQAWHVDRRFLTEFGLDAAASGRGISIAVLCVVAFGVLFWGYTASTPTMTLPWFAVVAASAGALLALRELRRSPYTRFVPAAAAALVAAFVVLGGVGAAHVSPAAFGAYALLVVMAQGMLLRHEEDVVEAGQSVLKAVERMTSPGPTVCVAEHEATPLRMGEVAPLSTAGGGDAEGEADLPLRMWLPCGGCLVGLFEGAHVDRGDRCARTRRTRAYDAARVYGLRATSSTAQEISAVVWLQWAVWAAVAVLAMLAIATALTAEAPVGLTAAAPADSVTEEDALPVCRLAWEGWATSDLALLSALAYEAEPAAAVKEWFDANATDGAAAAGGVAWVHASRGGAHVVAVRGRGDGRELVRDLQTWGDRLLLEALAVVAPVLRWWRRDSADAFLAGLRVLPESFQDGDADAAAELAAYVADLKAAAPGARIIVTGHGLAGGHARAVAAAARTEAVTFNAPGAAGAGGAAAPRELAVVTTHSVLPRAAPPRGAVQTLPCPASASALECGGLRATLCAVLRRCGDARAAAACPEET
eukprot:TRINITY_DN1140_c2_g1_i1.p1 TRINITY_DN1140_c2_g1~~TRINITY_DN1140_c2_g1_i1.p1  ORF type:complete len:1109 (+),score=406.46 TRINITY_DN1140_c2_g1_i1:40-3366(+)